MQITLCEPIWYLWVPVAEGLVANCYMAYQVTLLTCDDWWCSQLQWTDGFWDCISSQFCLWINSVSEYLSMTVRVNYVILSCTAYALVCLSAGIVIVLHNYSGQLNLLIFLMLYVFSVYMSSFFHIFKVLSVQLPRPLAGRYSNSYSSRPREDKRLSWPGRLVEVHDMPSPRPRRQPFIPV